MHTNDNNSERKPALLVLWEAPEKQMSELESAYKIHRLSPQENEQEALNTLLSEFGDQIDAIATTGHKVVSKEMLERMPNLKIVSSSSAGYEYIDVEACRERSVIVTNTSVALVDDVADIAIALMLATRRRLVVGDHYARSGDWATKGMLPLTTRLRDKKLGIVGCGLIGQAIAARAIPMGLDIAYFGRNRQADLPYRFVGDLIELATSSDILILSCPGGSETYHLVDSAVLAALGANGTLVNISRGTVVDEVALIDALSNGVIASAGLDVFADEPNIAPEMARMDNVVLYPHHASGTIETRDHMAQLMVDNLAAHFAGKPVLTPV